MPMISARELLGPFFNENPDIRVGWPDDEVALEVKGPDALRAELATVLARFRTVWPSMPLFADIKVNTVRQTLYLRLGAARPPMPWPELDALEASARAALEEWVVPLSRCAEQNGGGAHGGGGFVSLELPLPAEVAANARRDFPSLPDEDWDECYRVKLARMSWHSLRDEVYRFCDLATQIARWTAEQGYSSVLIPSVGLCVHPWLFAHHSLSVIATDISPTALDAVAHPERLPRMYGTAAKERWEVSEAAMWFGGRNPHSFEPMPDLERAETAGALRPRIRFVEADGAALPVGDASVDVLFATNALPREDFDLFERVVREWARVVRPGGFVFSAMHNGMQCDLERFSERLGWRPVDALKGEPAGEATGFQQSFSGG
jgi:SAM-dependent methyltransferase